MVTREGFFSWFKDQDTGIDISDVAEVRFTAASIQANPIQMELLTYVRDEQGHKIWKHGQNFGQRDVVTKVEYRPVKSLS